MRSTFERIYNSLWLMLEAIISFLLQQDTLWLSNILCVNQPRKKKTGVLLLPRREPRPRKEEEEEESTFCGFRWARRERRVVEVVCSHWVALPESILPPSISLHVTGGSPYILIYDLQLSLVYNCPYIVSPSRSFDEGSQLSTCLWPWVICEARFTSHRSALLHPPGLCDLLTVR